MEKCEGGDDEETGKRGVGVQRSVGGVERNGRVFFGEGRGVCKKVYGDKGGSGGPVGGRR